MLPTQKRESRNQIIQSAANYEFDKNMRHFSLDHKRAGQNRLGQDGQGKNFFGTNTLGHFRLCADDLVNEGLNEKKLIDERISLDTEPVKLQNTGRSN